MPFKPHLNREGESVNWPLARDWYVGGFHTFVKDDGSIGRRRPTQADIARRFKVSEGAVSYHATREGWRKQREGFVNAHDVEIAEAAGKLAAHSMGDCLETINLYCVKFREALEKGEVRAVSIVEFEKAVRAKGFVEQRVRDAASTSKESPTSLSQLQTRHAAQRAAVAELDPLLTGDEDASGKVPVVAEVDPFAETG